MHLIKYEVTPDGPNIQIWPTLKKILLQIFITMITLISL